MFKRGLLALVAFFFVVQANAIVFLAAPGIWVALGLGSGVMALTLSKKDPNTLAKQVGLTTFSIEHLGTIRLFAKNGKRTMYKKEEAALERMRDMLEEQYGAETSLHDVPGMMELLTRKNYSHHAKRVKADVGALTIAEYLGTHEDPKLNRLANLAIRLLQYCRSHKKQCLASATNSVTAVETVQEQN